MMICREYPPAFGILPSASARCRAQNKTKTKKTKQKKKQDRTPTKKKHKKKRGYFSGKEYIITIAKSGYRNQTILVKTRPNGWYLAGNLQIGGLIGYLIVDPLTGAMRTNDTKANKAKQANDGVSHSGAMGLNVVML